MADTGDERQDVTAEEVVAPSPGWLGEALTRMPRALRRGLGWCAVAAGVALIFSLSSLAAWWPR